jgi:hypothetical protein
LGGRDQEDSGLKQLGQIVYEILSQKHQREREREGRGRERRREGERQREHRTDRVVQGVGHLPSKCESLSSNPSTTKIFFFACL